VRHIIVGDDATGIGIGKATLDHEAECKFPDKFLAGTVVRLLLQQAHEIFFWRGHVRNLAPTGSHLQRRAPAAPTANCAHLATIADDGCRCVAGAQSTCRSKRPALNTTVTYELARDDRGRPQARQIRYSSTSRPPVTRQAPASSSTQLTLAIVGASAFLIVVTALVVIGRAVWWVLPWYLVLSAVTFVLYGWDKVSAEGGHWRTQESTLNGLALLGGWPGAWIAQHAWRHKSRKESFLAAFWVAVVMNLGALTALVLSGGDPLRLLFDR